MSVVRRALQVVAVVCTLIAGATVMAVIVTQTAWFKDWLRGFIVRQAGAYVNGELSIGRLDGDLFFGVELEDVAVTANGKTVVAVKDVGLDYNAFTFLRGAVVLDDIRLNQPVVRLERTADGWNITNLIKARTPDPDTPRTRRPLQIGEIGISDGTLLLEGQPLGAAGLALPSRIERLDASIRIVSNADELRVEIGHASLRGEAPSIGVNALSGVIRRTPDVVTLDQVSLRTEESSLRVDGTITSIEGGEQELALDVSSDKLALPEFARLVPALRGYDLQPAFELTARGPIERLEVAVNAREASLGAVRGNLTVDAGGPDRRIAGAVEMNALNIAPLGGESPWPESLLTGTAQIDLALPSGGLPLSGTYIVTAPQVRVATYEAQDVHATGRIDGRTVRIDGRAAAYGGRATAAGTVEFGQPLSLDLAGRAEGVDLRNLPPTLGVPEAPSNLRFAYTLTGRGRLFSGTFDLEASTLAGAAVAEGTTGSFRFVPGEAPQYSAKGQVTGLDVQQVGQGFEIPALATERYRSSLNATFDVAGSGGGRYPLTLDATATLVDSQMFGAAFPHLDLTARFAGGDANIDARGQVGGLDPAVVAGDERVTGSLGGTVDAAVTLRGYADGVTADSLDVAGRVELTDSRLRDFEIRRAIVAGRYADRSGELAELTIAGPDVNVSGSGTIALNDTGSSDLELHVESPSLERLGAILGQPLKGAVVIDATITGNARELRAEGALQGSNIGHGNNEALSLQSTFAALVPDVRFEDASLQAETSATFVEISGQRINSLYANTTYDRARGLHFEAVAREGPRELTAEGTAIFHPDHSEVHLANLALRAEQIEWRTEPGSSPVIQYGGEQIAIQDLRLVSGEQRIEVDGTRGAAEDALNVRASNVDVAQLDRLALGDERLAGRLSADAVVSGPADAFRIEGMFTLSNGAFRDFSFESLSGTVDYVGSGVNVDIRLQQSPQAWLTATGYAPLSLFRRNPEGTAGHEAPEPGEAVDLRIATSQIDLGVVQGFTTYVTDVTGVLQADIRVTGTGHDPHVDGFIDIRGGAFSVPDLGTAYTGLDTRIQLVDEAGEIGEMRIVDEHGQVMLVGGRLAVHAGAVGEFDVRVQSENFEVIDNELADLKLDTDLRLAGELRAPRLQGFVEVASGTVDVARVMERATASPYEVTVIPFDELPPAPPPGAAALPALGPASFFEALDLELGIGVPGNLVLRGEDVRPANAPIDIGDMVVTVGGAVQVRKTPGGQVQLLGEVNTVRGNYTFQGRRFEILRDGRIRFAGGDEIDPIIDLRARRIISGVETFVRVQGSVRQPELTFSSNPPLDQADILSLIVFNMPINELGEGQQISLAERAGALAGGYLASGLARSIANALELDEFEIQAQGERGLAPSIAIGEQVGERLFFRIRQGFGAEQATEFILEYQIADYLRLQGAVAETAGGTQRVTFRRIERAGLDLIFFFSY